jgi:hypothetical protein
MHRTLFESTVDHSGVARALGANLASLFFILATLAGRRRLHLAANTAVDRLTRGLGACLLRIDGLSLHNRIGERFRCFSLEL